MIEYTVKVYNNGAKCWFLNDKLHREDGPAVEYADGNKSWYIKGLLHREDGPACEDVNGNKSWFIHDEELTEEQFNNRNNSNKSCNNKIIEIDGKKYKLTEV